MDPVAGSSPALSPGIPGRPFPLLRGALAGPLYMREAAGVCLV